MMTRARRLVVSATLSWLLAAAGCGDDIGPGNLPRLPGDAIQAHTVVVKQEMRPLVLEVAGTVSARAATTLSSKAMGAVTAIRVKEGDAFSDGDVLIELDHRQASARLKQAEADADRARSGRDAARSALEGAHAQARLASSTLERYRLLKAEETVSAQEFDEVSERSDAAAAGLRQAEAMARASGDLMTAAESVVAEARVGVDDTRVTAPFDGFVVRKRVEVGDLATPGMPLLLVERKGGHRVEVGVPEGLGADLRVGHALDILAPSVGDRLIRGTVEVIEPAVDPATRTALVKIGLPEAKGIRSGMFVRVHIPSNGDGRRLTIPASAVVREGQLTGVFRVDDAGTARFHLVRLLAAAGDRIEVVSGLAAGDRIVDAPPPVLADGMRVEAAP
ncbi:MAG: efflux RND transporter periplasmic adaptor subunit [Desulfobacterales bacterium]